MGIQLKTAARDRQAARGEPHRGGRARRACRRAIAPGVTTWELNEIAVAALEAAQGRSRRSSATDGYPAVLCTSVNEVVVHGIPRKDVVLKDGDIVSIDFGAFKDGWCGDSARTVAVGRGSQPAAQALMASTREALERAIAQCAPGQPPRRHRLGGPVARRGAGAIRWSRQFVGHGIGRAMHEDPHVPNYGEPGKGGRLSAGLVIAIEPMVNAGGPDVVIEDDGWTAVTKDGSLSAHFEHSVAITDDGPVRAVQGSEVGRSMRTSAKLSRYGERP